MIDTDLTPRTAAVVQLLERAHPRLAQLMGIEPEVAEVTEGSSEADSLAPAVQLMIAGVGVGLAVLPPSDEVADQVANVPSVIAEHLVSVLPAEGLAAEVVSESEATAPTGEPVAVVYVAAEKPVGTIVVWAEDGLAQVLEQTTAPSADSHAESVADSGPDAAQGPEAGLPGTDSGRASQGASVLAAEAARVPSVAAPPLAALGNLSQVELNVTVELGSTEVTIRQLLDLAPGSVVRVGTQIGDPFRILVNGRPAATGDLVVVNGRLGIRIRQVITN